MPQTRQRQTRRSTIHPLSSALWSLPPRDRLTWGGERSYRGSPYEERPWQGAWSASPARQPALVCEPLGGTTPGQSLDALVDCARAGDGGAFRQVTEQLAPPLVRFVTGYLRGDEDTAHDVVQETFMQAWHKLDQIADGSHLRPWLYKVARYKAISFLRRRGPRGQAMESIDRHAEHGFHLESDLHMNPIRRAMCTEPPDPWLGALETCIERLPPTFIAVVRLHYLHGHTVAEVAHLLGIARPAVKMRLLRARRLLKRLVIEELEARRGS